MNESDYHISHVSKSPKSLYSGEFIVAIQDGRVPTFIVLGKYLTYLENILDNTPRLRIFITGEALRCIKLDVGPSIEPSGPLQIKVNNKFQYLDSPVVPMNIKFLKILTDHIFLPF